MVSDSPPALHDLVDLSKYPLPEGGAAGERPSWLEAQRQSLETEGFAHLPGFLNARALDAIRAEVEVLFATEGLPFRSSEEHNISLFQEDTETEAKLPLQSSSKMLVAADQLSPGSPLLALYNSSEFLAVLAQILDRPVFRSVDPMNKVHLNWYGPADALGWHHDNSEFAFNLLLSQSAVGGDFEFVKDSLGDTKRICAAVGPKSESVVSRLPMEAGSALIFRGHDSMHRVTKVLEGPPRISAIFNFASQEGGGLIEDYTRRRFFGRSLAAS